MQSLASTSVYLVLVTYIEAREGKIADEPHPCMVHTQGM
jgi:hypothetical protein